MSIEKASLKLQEGCIFYWLHVDNHPLFCYDFRSQWGKKNILIRKLVLPLSTLLIMDGRLKSLGKVVMLLEKYYVLQIVGVVAVCIAVIPFHRHPLIQNFMSEE